MSSRKSRSETRRDFIRDLAIGAGGLVVAPTLLTACAGRMTAADRVGWDLVPHILARIKAPSFPAREFRVTNFGAIGDGKTDCTAAFAATIAECSRQGGGRVHVPAGRFLTGAIHLRSNVNLHVAEGATILFSTDPRKYLPVVLTRFEGVEAMNYSPLIY